MKKTIPESPRQKQEREERSRLLKNWTIATACVVPLAAYSFARGYFDSKGIPLIENTLGRRTLAYSCLIPAVLSIGQMIPFRFDNIDPGILSTGLAIPTSFCLVKLCYAGGHYFGSTS